MESAVIPPQAHLRKAVTHTRKVETVEVKSQTTWGQSQVTQKMVVKPLMRFNKSRTIRPQFLRVLFYNPLPLRKKLPVG